MYLYVENIIDFTNFEQFFYFLQASISIYLSLLSLSDWQGGSIRNEAKKIRWVLLPKITQFDIRKS